MKVVLALLLFICLIQISFGEQEDIANAASSVGNRPLQREVREATRGCKQGGKNCRGELGQEKKKNRKNRRKRKISKTKKSKKAVKKNRKNRRKVKQSKTKKSTKAAKNAGNVEKKKS